MPIFRLLPRLLALNAQLDEALQFYIPNEKALARSVALVKTRSVGKTQWQQSFRAARLSTPKPPETLLKKAAILDYNGTVHHGPSHALIGADIADKIGWDNLKKHTSTPFKLGFTTDRQKYVSRGEAAQISKRAGVIQKPAAWR